MPESTMRPKNPAALTRAIILAAGRGERMRPLTDTLPKPLLEVGGKPLIVWQILRLRAAGITELVINTAWLAHTIESALGNGQSLGVNIQYSIEPVTAYETGGGIATALDLLGAAPFVAVSADIHTDFDYSRLHEPARVIASNPQQTCAHFVLVDNPPHHAAGDMALQDQRVRRQGSLLNYGNIAVFHPALFADQPRATQWRLFPWAYRFVEDNRVSGEHFRGAWDNIGTPEQLHAVDARLRAGLSTRTN